MQADMAAHARSTEEQLASMKAKHAQDLQSLQVCRLYQWFTVWAMSASWLEA